MPTAQHRKFDEGVNRDLASFLLGDGYLVDSKNIIFDKLGIARKRGGITGVGSTTTYNADHLGVLLRDDGTSGFYAMRANSGGVYSLCYVNVSTGALTTFIATAAGDQLVDGGRPFQHHGFLIWPAQVSVVGTPVQMVWTAGPTAAGAFIPSAACTITAGDKQIAVVAADSPLANCRVGDTFYASWGGGTPGTYVGRVTRLVSTTALEVFPTPTASNGGIGTWLSYAGLYTQGVVGAGVSLQYIGAKVGVSYQGRVLLGNCNRYSAVAPVRLDQYPRRIYFSSTLLEGDATGGTTTGALWLTPNGFPNYNYFDLPGSDPITAMAPTGFGDLVVFTATRTFRITGNLSTQYGTSQSITWQVREVPNSVGCMSERSLQRTPRGIIFAHDSGIYVTDGSSMQPIMQGRVANIWKGLVAGASFRIYGSGLIYGNHYYICGVSGGTLWGLLVNLDTLAWGPLGGRSTAPASWIANSIVQDPASPSNVYGLKWFDKTGAAPSMTGGQVLLMNNIFNPTTSPDSDTTVVGFGIVTPAYNENTPTVQKLWRAATLEYKNLGGVSVTVIPDYDLEAPLLSAVAGATSFLLPRQDAITVSAATNAIPIVLTVPSGHGITADQWVYVTGVLGNTAANGKWRVSAVAATTITLSGSAGNAAYTSGGILRALDQRDIPLVGSGTLEGLGPAVSYRISNEDPGLNAVTEFELQAITHSYDQLDPHDE